MIFQVYFFLQTLHSYLPFKEIHSLLFVLKVENFVSELLKRPLAVKDSFIDLKFHPEGRIFVLITELKEWKVSPIFFVFVN